MKIKKNIRKTNKLFLIIIASSFVGLIILASIFAFKVPSDKPTANEPQPKGIDSSKQQTDNIKNPDNKTKTPNTDLPAAPTTTDNSSKKHVQMVASTDRSDGTIFIRGGINYPVSGGSCYALLHGPSGQTIRKDTSILINPSSTDCKTISIKDTELTAGNWTFTLNYTSAEYEGISNEVTFTL